MPNFLVTILFSLLLRLLTNEVFLQKVVRLIVVKIKEACLYRDLTILASLLDSFIDWIDSKEGEHVIAEVAHNLKNDGESMEKIKGWAKECS